MASTERDTFQAMSSNVIEARGLFLLDQAFEEADIFGLQNFDLKDF